MDIEDQKLMFELQAINSDAKVLKLKYRRVLLERQREINSPDFDPVELAKVKALLDLLGNNHEL
jgi:hypothetical protein